MNVPDPIIIALISLAGSQGLIVVGYIFKKLLEHDRHCVRTETRLELMETMKPPTYPVPRQQKRKRK